MSISEDIIEENMRLRQEVQALKEEVERIRDRQAEQHWNANQFMARFYRTVAMQIAGEWKEIGDSCGWTPEQIALAESLANGIRQRIYRMARTFES